MKICISIYGEDDAIFEEDQLNFTCSVTGELMIWQGIRLLGRYKFGDWLAIKIIH